MSETSHSRRSFCAAFRIRNELIREFLGELVGTMTLLILGIGVMAQHMLGSEKRLLYGSLISVTLGWGFAIYMGVFVSGKSGKGHINPAISLAMAITGRLEWYKLPIYMIAQYIGAFLGAIVNFVTYAERIYAMETKLLNLATKNVTVFSMSATGGIFTTMPGTSWITCFWDQLLGTALLAGIILTIIDPNNYNPPQWSQPLLIGLGFFSIAGGFALNAGGALNPARDFSPRVMLYLFGWNRKAFTHDNYYFWIPLVATHVGAIFGACGYDLLIGNHLPDLQPEMMIEKIHLKEEYNRLQESSKDEP